ncbi:MAG: hypothetical protein IKB70_02095 [Bacilli bacterium]|nr:hypothetical protein [Bacilli bacterium]
MEDDILLEPLKAYKSVYKDAVNEEAGKFFDELVGKSKIDVEANRQTIKQYKKTLKEAEEVNKKLSGLKTGRGFSIFGIIVGFLVAIGFILLCFSEEPDWLVNILCIIGGLALGIGLIVLIVKVLNPKIKNQTNIYNSLMAKAKELSDLAYAQMAPLNALYDWNMPTTIIERVIPILDFDKYFDGSKYLSLIDNYGFSELTDPDTSTLYVQSGTILGNPFLIQKQKCHRIIQKVYTGSIVITWTETYRNSNGQLCTRTRTQTLTASVTHPAPEYTNQTALIYGNDAAPDLSFSREPSGMTGKSDKEIRKHVRSKEDDLRKLAEKSIKRGDENPFTPLANTEFELLFGALDRDHNVQYRLLFTPLAQKNQVDLIRSSDGYGDDYYVYKRKKINIVSSRHSQNEDLSGNPSIFIGNDHDVARKIFIDHVNNFFKAIYFDFAPLLSIPLYQQMKSMNYIYGSDCPYNYSAYEHEVFANTFPEEYLKDPDSITTCMLKTRVIRTDGKSDKIEITAYSYRGEDRVDYVKKMGGDGRIHTIPVYWTEYIPLMRTSLMELRNLNASRFDFNNKMQDNRLNEFISRNSQDGMYSFQRGLMAILAGHEYCREHDLELDSIFKKDEQ